MASLQDFGYEDVKVIGRGQYGKAHLVRSTAEQKHFIAKTIDLTCLSSKEHETARQEVALLRRLKHANIVEYKDNFFMGDTLVIIMQYCEGGDLASYIKEMFKKKMRIHERQIMNYFVQVLQALEYIHSERILHRDLKTSNLFLTKSMSVVKLGDFGISRVLEGSIEAAVTVVGTPYYMSPEVCENKPYTFKSDVWSLGCVLYELCMLKHAFSADNLLGLVYKIVSDKYEPIPKLYSQELNALIQRMLEKNAEKRPSVRELLEDSYVHSFMSEYVHTRGQCAAPAAAPRASLTRSTSGAKGSVPVSGQGGASSGGPPGEGAAVPPGIAGGGAPRRPAPKRSRPAQGARETPHEAMMRRKREAADRKAEEVKVAAAQAHKDKTIARKMKEAEFKLTSRNQSTNAETSGPVAATTSSTAIPEDEEYEEDYGSSCDDDYYDEEGYDDDFEDADSCSEEEGDDEEGPFEDEVDSSGVFREQEDVKRVMSNFEQGLARATSGQVSPQRSLEERPLKPTAAPVAATGPDTPLGGNMDLKSRANRLKQELTQKMGEENFQKAFDFLLDMRSRNVSFNRKELEGVVGKENYGFCFDIDQLVFSQLLYG